MSAKTRFKCVVCGKLTRGRIDRGGDGSERFASRHKNADGIECQGGFELAEWVDVEPGSTRKPKALKEVSK